MYCSVFRIAVRLMQVYDSSNHDARSKKLKDFLNNLNWLLGLPFEIFVRIDQEYLPLNDKKNDLVTDASTRGNFYSAVHSAVALDVMRRMEPGLKRLIAESRQSPSSPPVTPKGRGSRAAPSKPTPSPKRPASNQGKGVEAGPSSPAPATPARKAAGKSKAKKRPAPHNPASRKRKRVPIASPEPSLSEEVCLPFS